MELKLVLCLILALLDGVYCFYIDQNVSYEHKFHFSEKASVCPNSHQNRIYIEEQKSEIMNAQNFQINDTQYFTLISYMDSQIPSKLILWDQEQNNHQQTTLEMNDQQITMIINPIYMKDQNLLVFQASTYKTLVFEKESNHFKFNLVNELIVKDQSDIEDPFITDMFFLDKSSKLVLLDFNKNKLFFYENIKFQIKPFKIIDITIPDIKASKPYIYCAKHIPNTQYIAVIDLPNYIIRVFDYNLSEIIYTYNQHILSIPANPSTLGIYEKDSLIIFFNNNKFHHTKQKMLFQVFSFAKELTLVSKFQLEYKNEILNGFQSMFILQDSPHVITSHKKGDIYIHNLYSGQLVRYYKNGDFTAFSVKLFDKKFIYTTTDTQQNIINYFYDWNAILYQEERDLQIKDQCVAQCNGDQEVNFDLLSCQTSHVKQNCDKYKFPEKICEKCKMGYYLLKGQCLPYCKGEQGSFTFKQPDLCICNQGYYKFDENICLPNICLTQNYPENDFRDLKTICNKTCREGFYYFKEKDECVCNFGFIKIDGECKLDIKSIILIAGFFIMIFYLIFKYRRCQAKQNSIYQIKDIKSEIQLSVSFKQKRKNLYKEFDNEISFESNQP